MGSRRREIGEEMTAAARVRARRLLHSQRVKGQGIEKGIGVRTINMVIGLLTIVLHEALFREDIDRDPALGKGVNAPPCASWLLNLSLEAEAGMREAKALLLLVFLMLLSGCASIVRIEHPIREGVEKYPIGGLRRAEYPLLGVNGTFKIATQRIETTEGSFVIYSTRFYGTGCVLGLQGMELKIVKFDDEDGPSSYALVYVWCTTAMVELSMPEAIDLEIDGTIYPLDYDFSARGAFIYSIPLPQKIVTRLRNADSITIWIFTLSESQRLILQSFLETTRSTSYNVPLAGL